MQYEWEDGDPILAGGLYTGTTHVLDPSDIPNLKLLNEIPNTETPGRLDRRRLREGRRRALLPDAHGRPADGLRRLAG